MEHPSTFYLYRVIGPKGTMTHSSVFYPDPLEGDVPKPAEIREAILTSIGMANGEFEFPDHGEAESAFLMELHGPYAVTEPLATMTHAEYNDVQQDHLP